MQPVRCLHSNGQAKSSYEEVHADEGVGVKTVGIWLAILNDGVNIWMAKDRSRM
jgi:hypothetical protein